MTGSLPISDLKNHPSVAWIADLRRRFPLDRETDRILTRKLEHRASDGFQPLPLETLCAGVRSLLAAEGVQGTTLSDASWLAGGASKLQMAFTLAGGDISVPRRCVLRMEPAASIVETSRLQEFQVLKALHTVVPAPEPYWVDPEGSHLPYPALIYAFVDGVTKPTGSGANVSNIGVNFGPVRRPIIAEQYVTHLATIHGWDWRSADLSAFETPDSPAQAIDWQLNKWERIWEEDCNEDIPLVGYAQRWLRDHQVVPDRISMLQGDCRAGNFLFTEHDNRITALLDWELAHLGDRHEELALVNLESLGHLAEDGKTFLVTGMMPEEAFYERYEQVSGLKVDRRSLDYYRVFNAYRVAVNLIATAYRVAQGGKSHQDIVVTWIMGMGYSVLGDLPRLLGRS